jgi:hypothetical protein
MIGVSDLTVPIQWWKWMLVIVDSGGRSHRWDEMTSDVVIDVMTHTKPALMEGTRWMELVG